MMKLREECTSPEPGLLSFIINEFQMRAVLEKGEAGDPCSCGTHDVSGCGSPLGGYVLDPGTSG